MGVLSHYIDPSEVKRGDHLYALRVAGTYQHHGIAISGIDATRIKKRPECIEEVMVIEQNRGGLNVVTLKQFCYEERGFIKWTHNLRRAQYRANPLAYEIKRRGSCYIQSALPPDNIVDNAISVYNNDNERKKWSSYSLGTRNCEHFAFKCCTDIGLLSEQVLAGYDKLTNTFSILGSTSASIFWICKDLLKSVVRIGEKIIPSSISNLTITSLDEVFKSCLPGNAITAGIALAVEVAILTARWLIYLYVRHDQKKCEKCKKCEICVTNAECEKCKICKKYEKCEKYKKCEKYLAAGYAIKSRTYVKCLITAVVANANSFLFSLAGAMIGAWIPLPGTVVGFSIFFGFIGYLIGRCGCGAITNLIERMITDENE